MVRYQVVCSGSVAGSVVATIARDGFLGPIRVDVHLERPPGLGMPVAERPLHRHSGTGCPRSLPLRGLGSVLEGADAVNRMPPGMGRLECEDIALAHVSNPLLHAAILAVETVCHDGTEWVSLYA